MSAVEHPIDPQELMAYRDGELPAARAAIVESHIASCAACRSHDHGFSRVSGALATWTIEKAPETLGAAVAESTDRAIPAKRGGDETIAAAPGRSRWFPSWGFYGYAVAASAVALAVALPLMLSGARKRPPAFYAYSTQPTSNSPAQTVTAARPPAAVPTSPVATVLGGVRQGGTTGQKTSTPHIVRTASLQVVAKDFEGARSSLSRIVIEMGGFVGTLDVTGVPPDKRTLNATIRIPAARLDAAAAALKAIGTVTSESQSADDVTEQALDLEARIANGRHTEKRLNDLLQKRTGELSDVLAAEREIARVREEIERLDAQRQNLESRVTYATISLRIEEELKSTVNLGPVSLSTRFRNAFVDGFETMFVTVVEAALVALQIAPTLLVWGPLILGSIYVIARLARRSASASG